MAKINALALLITNHRSLITFSAVTFAPEAFNSQGNYKNSSDTLFRLLGASLACKRQSGPRLAVESSDRLRPRNRQVSSSNATNPELRATITVRNRHDPNRVSPNDVGDVVRKSAQIDSAVSF
jgi:hypothetical protein